MLNDLNIKLISSHLHLCIICKLQTSCEILKQQHIARRRVLNEILLKNYENEKSSNLYYNSVSSKKY